MGEVYRAHDPRLGRDVAIKVLPEKLSKDSERLWRFEQEARATGALNHPNILAIYDIGDHDGSRFIVSELLEGETLRSVLSAGSIPQRRAIEYGSQIAAGLAAAHDKGIVHRDLKPENLFVTRDDHLKILDFGLAKLSEAVGENQSQLPTRISEPGVVLGTIGYMSPEQVRGKDTDHRADIFAFGAVLYEVLSGRKAFERDSAADTMSAILKEDVPELTSEHGTIPAGLDRVVRRCLEKKPEQRFRSASDLGFALETLSSSSGSSSSAIAPPPRARSRKAILVWSVLIPLIAIAAFLLGARRSGAGDSNANEWAGERLSGTAISYGPRVSPDGRTLAFLAMINGLTQVGVMTPESGDWSVLTQDRTRGLVTTACWSANGTQIFFDRYLDKPLGVFSVSAIGSGDERLVLPDALVAEALSDGSLLVAKVNAGVQQVHRFWPETQRLEPLNAFLDPRPNSPPVRFVPGRDEIVFFGKAEASDTSAPHLYALGLASGRSRRLAPDVGIPLAADEFPLALTTDGRNVMFNLPADDLHRIVAVPLDGSSLIRPVATLTEAPWFLDAGADGSIYVDQSKRRGEILRFSPADRKLERFAVADMTVVLNLPDGRMVVRVRATGRWRLMVLTPGGDPLPFIQTQDETSGPATMLGEDRVAFMLGAGASRSVSIASADGRLIGRIPEAKGAIDSLAATPDGKTLFYSTAGNIWSIPSSGGTPTRIHSGSTFAIDHSGTYLVVQEANNALVRVPLSGGPDQPISTDSAHRLAPSPWGIGAIGKDGRLAVRLAPKDSWFWPAAILDPRTGKIETIPAGFDADMAYPAWDRQGRLVTSASTLSASLWRLRPIKP